MLKSQGKDQAMILACREKPHRKQKGREPALPPEENRSPVPSGWRSSSANLFAQGPCLAGFTLTAFPPRRLNPWATRTILQS